MSAFLHWSVGTWPLPSGGGFSLGVHSAHQATTDERKPSVKVNADYENRLEILPENESEERFVRDVVGIFKYLRGPIMTWYGDITIDGLETVGYVITEFPFESVTADETVAPVAG